MVQRERAPAIPPFLIAPCSRQRFLCPRFQSSGGSPPFSIRRMLCEPRDARPWPGSTHSPTPSFSTCSAIPRLTQRVGRAGRWVNWQRSFQTARSARTSRRHTIRKTAFRVIRLQNIGVGAFLDTDKVFISEQHFATLKKHECLPGDVIAGTMGDPNLRACVQPGWLRIALNKADCVQIRPDMRVCNSDYVCALLNEPDTETMAHQLILVRPV